MFLKKKKIKCKLVVKKGPDEGNIYEFENKAVIGRGESCDITLTDTQVSRKHLSVKVENDKVIIRDLGSSNGTYVNGEKIEKAELDYENLIQIGRTEFYITNKSGAELDSSTENVVLTEEKTFSDESLKILSCKQPTEQLAYEKERLVKFLSISNKIYSTLDINKVQSALMEGIFEIFPHSEKSVLLLKDEGGNLYPSASKVRDEISAHIRISKTILDKVTEKKSAVLSSNVLADADYKFSESIILDKIKSFMCAPLYIKDNLIGVFYVDTTKIEGAFTEDDLRFFIVICNQVAMVVYNAKLYSEIKDLAKYNENILHSISSGIIVIDNESVIKTFNRVSEEIFHIKAKDVLGKKISDVGVLKSIENGINKIQSGNNLSKRLEIKLFDEISGQEKIIGLGTSFLKDHNQNIKGLIAFFEDLTEITKLNQRLQQSKRLAVLGEMAANVAHEIRNPLNSIRGFAQLFYEGIYKPENVKEYSQIIIQEVDRLNRLVEDLLDFGREKKIEKEKVVICKLIEQTLEYVKKGCNDSEIEWSLKCSEDIKTIDIYVDPNKIKQVLINFYRNAVDALEGRPEKKIDTDVYRDENDDMVVISVKDTGSGIPESKLKKIFNPFYSTKKKGSGLGLSICQRIIEEHGGFIEVESKENEGSNFKIFLPLEV